jgi:hypothetical protein
MTHSCLEFYHNRTKYFYAGSKKREQLLRFWGAHKTEFMNFQLLVQTIKFILTSNGLYILLDLLSILRFSSTGYYFAAHEISPWTGTVAHACNPIYLGGRDWEDSGWPARANKKVAKPHFNQ